MSNLFSEEFGTDIAAIRRRVRRSAHAHNARVMMVAAGLCAFGLVAVAATLLTSVIQA